VKRERAGNVAGRREDDPTHARRTAMNAAHVALSFTIACAAALTACNTTDADDAEHPASAPSELKGAYGYELFPARLDAEGAAKAPAPSEVNGRVAPEIALDVLRSSHGALRACERSAIGRGEVPPGELRLRLTIGEDGAVSRVTASPSSAVLGACAQQAIGALRFPKSSGGAFEVVYPVAFGAGG
jgi:hypothetical protein